MLHNMLNNIKTTAMSYRDFCYVTTFMVYNKRYVIQHIPTFHMAH